MHTKNSLPHVHVLAQDCFRGNRRGLCHCWRRHDTSRVRVCVWHVHLNMANFQEPNVAAAACAARALFTVEDGVFSRSRRTEPWRCAPHACARCRYRTRRRASCATAVATVSATLPAPVPPRAVHVCGRHFSPVRPPVRLQVILRTSAPATPARPCPLCACTRAHAHARVCNVVPEPGVRGGDMLKKRAGESHLVGGLGALVPEKITRFCCAVVRGPFAAHRPSFGAPVLRSNTRVVRLTTRTRIPATGRARTYGPA